MGKVATRVKKENEILDKKNDKIKNDNFEFIKRITELKMETYDSVCERNWVMLKERMKLEEKLQLFDEVKKMNGDF